MNLEESFEKISVESLIDKKYKINIFNNRFIKRAPKA